MIGKSVSGPGWFWLVVDGEVGAMEVLTIGLAAGEEALPVFSFEDEAAMFLGLGGFDGDWRVRVTTAGELISVLFGPCAGVRRVVLDPLPAPYAALNGLVSVERKAFMEFIEASPRPGMESDRKPIRRFGAGVEAATRAGR
ncbi:MAG: hypothetical protein M3494_14620 [Actinomycetota bacterium]|nr:hypothetical protein [Rubrobacter sp.]MDQ3509223.1 hypothetical protein [Actinomycetota bacterium]